MGPDELELLQVLLSSGYTEEQAMQILNSGAFAPGVAPPAVQYAVANPGMTYDLNRDPLWATPTPQLEQAEYPSRITSGGISSGGISTGVGSPYAAPMTPYGDVGMADLGWSGQYGKSDVTSSTGDNYTGFDASIAGYPEGQQPSPIHAYADQHYAPRAAAGFKERSVGSRPQQVQAATVDRQTATRPTLAQVAARLVASGKAGAQQQMQSQSQRQPQARTQTQTQQPPPSGGGRASQKAAQPAFRARAADRRKA